MNSKIEKVEARTVRLPLQTATAFSTRNVLHRDYALVRVTTADGLSGIGFCYGGSAAGRLASDAVRTLMAPAILGQDSHRTAGLWEQMYAESILQGRTGSAMRALSAVDVALWDRNARAAGLPLHRYLGANAETHVPAYASGGYYLEGKTPEDLGRELAGYAAQGFRAVKMKVGGLGEAEEEARIAAAREAIGPDVLLMLDANNAWRDVPTALRFMRRFEPYDPYWIEEPFSPDDIQSHAALAELTSITVAVGEIEAGRWRFRDLIEQGAAAIIQPDAAVCGGITEFRRIAALAETYAVPLCPHWFHDLHVHLVAASPAGQFVEFFPDNAVLNFRDLVDTQLVVENGLIALPAGPGLGFGFDAAVIENHAQDDWA